MTPAWRRFAALDGLDRGLLVEAALLLPLVSAALRFFAFPRLRRFVDRYAGPPPLSPPAMTAILDRVSWAVDAAAKRYLFPSTCLVRALVADAMLRRRGLVTQLRVGVRLCGQPPARALEAHAWLECNDRVVVGDLADIGDYVVPAAPPVTRTDLAP